MAFSPLYNIIQRQFLSAVKSSTSFHTSALEEEIKVTDIMKAVIIKEAGKAEVAEVKEQAMRRDYIKVKTVAVALNPSI